MTLKSSATVPQLFEQHKCNRMYQQVDQKRAWD